MTRVTHPRHGAATLFLVAALVLAGCASGSSGAQVRQAAAPGHETAAADDVDQAPQRQRHRDRRQVQAAGHTRDRQATHEQRRGQQQSARDQRRDDQRGDDQRKRPKPWEQVEEPVKGTPTRIEIPSIDVDAPVIRLGLNPDHSLEVPEEWADTGWFEGGPKPGEQGPAVVAGHVDSKTGPAVFYRLGELQAGDRIDVAMSDGSTVAFRVDRMEQYPKGDFPTKLVYGLTSNPELRLITCDGFFDESIGHYQDNLVVFATMIG